MATDIFNGFYLGDIDSAAKELMHTLAELDLPVELSILALLRVITAIGTDSELDMASRLLDDLREVPFDGAEEDFSVSEGSEWNDDDT